MNKLIIAGLALLPMAAFAVDSTYMQCYGTKNSFEQRSDLIKKNWALNDRNQYVKLSGDWKDNSYGAKLENYFVVKQIDGIDVAGIDSSSEGLYQLLNRICRDTLSRQYSDQYISNIRFVAANSAMGNEYPILDQATADQLNQQPFELNYSQILRYAYAASYIYSLEPGANDFSFSADLSFQQTMLQSGQSDLEIIEILDAPSGMMAVAIKVPQVNNLPQEIIVAFKGTSNGTDVVQDLELMFANLIETDQDWQQDGYEFVQHIMALYPKEQGHRVVLTGHSLGAYTAIDAGVRTGLLTRVFSSPATRITDKYIHMFANKLHYSNVINLVRIGDPVVAMSGRHNENMIYFPAATASYDPGKSHYLTPFIKQILKPLDLDGDNSKVQATHLYLKANTELGAGYLSPYNLWGINDTKDANTL